MEGLIAARLGPVYQADPHNKFLRNPRFCVGLDLTKGWPSALEVIGLDNHSNTIVLNYDHAPIRCRFCTNLNQKVADCAELRCNGIQSFEAPMRDVHRRVSSPVRPLAPTTAQQAAPGVATIVQQPPSDDGFTLVRSRKSKHPPRPPSQELLSAQRTMQVANVPIDLNSNPPIPSSSQAPDQPDNPGVDAEGLPMVWSPGRYGRNPGSKRVAGNTSQQSSPVRSQATSKRLVISPPENPQPAQIRIPDPEGDLCILLDQSLAQAFDTIEAIRNQGKQTQTRSKSSSSLGLANYPTQNLASPHISDIRPVAPIPIDPGPSHTAPPPYGSLPLSGATCKAGRQLPDDLSDTCSESSSRVNLLKIAASYKAK
ncbi:hypothetical protein M758_UG082300 [Ceratodon purpureus]|nr:hypothetical protein M758_UG082300 [Ceratodon purpureus]